MVGARGDDTVGLWCVCFRRFLFVEQTKITFLVFLIWYHGGILLVIQQTTTRQADDDGRDGATPTSSKVGKLFIHVYVRTSMHDDTPSSSSSSFSIHLVFNSQFFFCTSRDRDPPTSLPRRLIVSRTSHAFGPYAAGASQLAVTEGEKG